MLLKHKIKKEGEGDRGSSFNFQVGKQLATGTEMSYELIATVAPAVCVSSKIFISCQFVPNGRRATKKEQKRSAK